MASKKASTLSHGTSGSKMWVGASSRPPPRPTLSIIRRTAVTQNIPYYTTVDGAQAAVGGIEALLKGEMTVQPLQDYHAPRS